MSFRKVSVENKNGDSIFELREGRSSTVEHGVQVRVLVIGSAASASATHHDAGLQRGESCSDECGNG